MFLKNNLISFRRGIAQLEMLKSMPSEILWYQIDYVLIRLI